MIISLFCEVNNDGKTPIAIAALNEFMEIRDIVSTFFIAFSFGPGKDLLREDLPTCMRADSYT